MTLHKFLITETCTYEIRAISMEHAKRRWLDNKRLWTLMQRSFQAVKARSIESLDAELPTVAEEF